MVSDTVFLRLKKAFSHQEGISLTEILISVTVIVLLGILILTAFKPRSQMAKARDARRKSDLAKLENLLEDYYNDHNCYPSSLNDLVLEKYIDQLPTDPETGDVYEYYFSGCQIYRVYVKLEYKEDPAIADVGCLYGCGPGGNSGTCEYNYGTCSSNTNLEGCPPPACDPYACSEGRCQTLAGVSPLPPTYYCNNCCDGACCGPAGCPWVCSGP